MKREYHELIEEINTFKGIKLRIFSYFLIEPTKGVSTNEVKNLFRLKSASLASYHLNQMYQSDILLKDDSNMYYLSEELRVKSIRMNTLVEYFVFNNRLWPRSLIFKLYIFMVFITTIVMLIINQLTIAIAFISINTLISTIFIIHDYRAGNSWLLPDDDTDQLYPQN